MSMSMCISNGSIGAIGAEAVIDTTVAIGAIGASGVGPDKFSPFMPFFASVFAVTGLSNSIAKGWSIARSSSSECSAMVGELRVSLETTGNKADVSMLLSQSVLQDIFNHFIVLYLVAYLSGFHSGDSAEFGCLDVSPKAGHDC